MCLLHSQTSIFLPFACSHSFHSLTHFYFSTPQVYAIIGAFRQSLLKKLEQPNLSLEEHVKTIGYLIELDCEDDPAWFCLRRYHVRFLLLSFLSVFRFEEFSEQSIPSFFLR
jgi:hypothetical protein